MDKKEKNHNKSARFVPEGLRSVTPYLVVDNAMDLIEFMEKAFGGEVTFISKADRGKVMHATVKIGDSIIMVSDTMEGMKPESGMLYLYVDDVDSVYRQAIKAKGSSISEPKDEFYGDRASAIKDPWGNKWWIATHIEDVDPEELEKRVKQLRKQPKENGAEVGQR